jgi:hypothetical protein
MTALFNSPLWNASLFGGGTFTVEQFSTDLLVFDGFSLSDGSSVMLSELLDSGPSREILTGNVPRGHGQYINGDFWREKTIEARGFAKAADAAALDTLLDTIRKRLRVREANLDITRNGTARRYVATLTNADELFAERQHFHITLCPFTARFSCKTPFGLNRDYTSLMSTISTSPSNITAENLGTADANPVITLIFNAATSVTVVNVKRLNSAGTVLDEIEYSGTIAANDALIFNSENRTVTKNTLAVTYVGAFPTVEPGSNIFKFTITGTSFSAVATVSHKNAYL